MPTLYTVKKDFMNLIAGDEIYFYHSHYDRSISMHIRRKEEVKKWDRTGRSFVSELKEYSMDLKLPKIPDDKTRDFYSTHSQVDWSELYLQKFIDDLHNIDVI